MVETTRGAPVPARQWLLALIAAGAGGPGAKGPSLELPPGKYRYSLKAAGHPAQAHEIEVAPDGEVMPLRVY
jgi:hypothetical protein